MMNSSSIPTSMEKISSSTASREKRGQWLAKSKTKFILKTVFALALVVACCVAVAVIVPHLKKDVKKTSAVYQSTHHNLKKNDTYGKDSMKIFCLHNIPRWRINVEIYWIQNRTRKRCTSNM